MTIVFRAKGSVPKFAGWLAVYGKEIAGGGGERAHGAAVAAGARHGEGDDAPSTGVLPALSEGQTLEAREIKPEQKFTQPPPRFNEGSLVKALEEDGIGRPSTYASIISRAAGARVRQQDRRPFRPTMLGRRLVDKLLHPVFDDILDVEYTARMEEQLDEIEKGKADYAETLKDFYTKFKKDLKRAAKEMPNFKEGQPTGITCDKCGEGEMVEKSGKFGTLPRVQPVSRLRQHEGDRDAGRSGHRGARRDVRELRQADGRQARPLRHVPRLHRLSGVQDDEEDHLDEAGRSSREARSDPRGALPELRQEPRDQARPLRRVHGVHRLSRVQVHQAQAHRRQLSRRTAATSSSASRGAARCSTAARTTRSATSRCGTSPSRAVPEVRLDVPHREDHEAPRPPARLQQRGVRLRAE